MQAFCQHVGTNGYRSDIHSRTCTHLTFAVVPRRSSSCSSLRRFSPCFCAGLLSSHPSSLDVCSCSSSATMALFDATHVRMLYWLLLLCKNAHQTPRKMAFHASALANLIHQAFLRKRVFRWERIRILSGQSQSLYMYKNWDPDWPNSGVRQREVGRPTSNATKTAHPSG